MYTMKQMKIFIHIYVYILTVFITHILYSTLFFNKSIMTMYDNIYVFYVNLSQKSNLRSLWFFLSLLWYLFCISEYRILRSVKYCFLECDIHERFMCLHRRMLKILKTGDNNHTVSTMNDEHCKAVFMYMFY